MLSSQEYTIYNESKSLAKVQKCYAKMANCSHIQVIYLVGTKVWLSNPNIALPKELHNKFIPKGSGSYDIATVVHVDVYFLTIPYWLRIHLVFYVSMLKLFVDSREAYICRKLRYAQDFEILDKLASQIKLILSLRMYKTFGK